MVRRRKAPKRRTTRRYVRPARSPPSRPWIRSPRPRRARTHRSPVAACVH